MNYPFLTLVFLTLFSNSHAGPLQIEPCPPQTPPSHENLLSRLEKAFGRLQNGKIPKGVNGELVSRNLEKGRDGALKAELHASAEPVTKAGHATNITICDGMSSHPIGGTLFELIENTPSGSLIQIAVFILKNPQIENALLRAIHRGVNLQILTTTQGEKMSEVLNDAIKKSALTNSWSMLCPNIEKDDNESSGGCHSDRLNHNKFAIFSSVCRFGFQPDGKSCFIPKNLTSPKDSRFHNIVFQATWNFGPISKYEMASVFFGNERIYNTYFSYFASMHKFALNKKNNLNLFSETNLNLSDNSVLQLNFTPRSRKTCNQNKDCNEIEQYRKSDLFLRELNHLDKKNCVGSSGRKTIIRIANTHWQNGPTNVATKIINRVAELVKAGCLVKVILPADMAAKTYNKPDSIKVSAGDANIYNGLVEAGAKVRTFAYAPNVPDTEKDMPPSEPGLMGAPAHMHAKVAMLEMANSKAENAKVLMFGTMSFNEVSQQKNDEAWHVWKNSNFAYNFYKDTFERMWNVLPEK